MKNVRFYVFYHKKKAIAQDIIERNVKLLELKESSNIFLNNIL